jgi:putative FmdB family regulatory protein
LKIPMMTTAGRRKSHAWIASIGSRRRGDARTFAGMTSAATGCDDRRAMPIYDYHCDHCGHSFSQVQSYKDQPLEKCPNCGKKPRRLISPSAVVFKGSGWYKTDSRPAEKSETKSETKSESKAETKPDTKSDVKAKPKVDGSPKSETSS